MLEKISESKMLGYRIKKGLNPFGQRIVEIGKQGARVAIAKHKAAGKKKKVGFNKGISRWDALSC